MGSFSGSTPVCTQNEEQQISFLDHNSLHWSQISVQCVTGLSSPVSKTAGTLLLKRLSGTLNNRMWLLRDFMLASIVLVLHYFHTSYHLISNSTDRKAERFCTEQQRIQDPNYRVTQMRCSQKPVL